MSEAIIYAAGNPDAYPIEYYDSETGSYEGLIPELLKSFSEQTDYDVIYYGADKDDEREQMLANLQVDIISGCDGTEPFVRKSDGWIALAETVKDGKTATYSIYLTDAAPESLDAELRGFLSGVTSDAKTEIMLETVKQRSLAEQAKMKKAVIGLSIVVFFLAFVIIALFRKNKRIVRDIKQNKEVDEVTGIGNMEHMAHYYKSLVQDKNRILYSMFYFYFDAERMERAGSYADVVEFLRYTATVLQDYTSDTDILARVSDSGFALLRLTASEKEAKEWFMPALNRIRGFSERYGKTYACDVSVGMYNLKADDRELNAILFNASQSAQSAYREGSDFKVCTDEVIRTLMEEKRLQADIGRGFSNGEFQLYIQFYVDTGNGKIVGGEALSRWEHPEKGLLTPARYISMMEKEGLISQLDYYSLEKACAFLEGMNHAGVKDFFISCNFSRETFSAEDFAVRCKKIMENYQFDRELLIFEITESAAIKNIVSVKKNIRDMKDMGIRIALDDFGEGFTSFFDIQEYPLDGLKLDKSLIDNLGTNPGDVILRAMIQVGHELGITVLAEGVETDEQIRILKEMNCDVIQGFRFHYPIPEWEARKELMEQIGNR